MLPLPSPWAHETRFSTEAGIPESWDIIVPIISGTCADAICSSLPQHGLREPISVPGCYTSTYFFAYGQHGPGHGSGLRSRPPGRYFRDQGHVYAMVSQTELADQYDIHGTFPLSHFLIECCLNSDASYSCLLLHLV